MKSNIRFKGKLRHYLQLPLMLMVLLVVLNIPLYCYDVKSGAAVTFFIIIYFGVVMVCYHKIKPVLVNELINFATQYATVQKRLLNEFEIPYALLDYNGKLLWVNEQF